MKILNKYIVRFANVLPVEGKKNFILCDLQKNNYWSVDKLSFEILSKYNKKRVIEIANSFKDINKDDLIQYFDFLRTNELIFFTDNPDYYPNLNLQWHEPYEITNLIIDIGHFELNIRDLMKSIANLQIFSVQLRFFSKKSKDEIISFIEILKETNIRTYELIIPFEENLTYSFLKKLTVDNDQLFLTTIYNSKENKELHLRDDAFGRIIFTKNNVNSKLYCGNIAKNSFIVNYKLYTESQVFNTCLNRKISIDIDGNIKNCPSMNQSFGNIRETTLEEALSKSGFKKYWYVNKNDITKCRDCEFRYI